MRQQKIERDDDSKISHPALVFGRNHVSPERKDFMPLSAVAKRAAVACIITAALAQAALAAASCTGAAQHLVTLIKSHWPSSDANTPGATGDMIGTFLHKSPSGFTPGIARFKLKAYSRAAFIKQAGRFQRPFTPPLELLKALDEVREELVVFDLPGSNLLAANSIGGTAGCNSTVFFSVSQGRARLVPGPLSWQNDIGGSCGLTRSFASVDGLPVVIDDDLDAGPRLASTLTLMPRGGGKWLDPCKASFVFAPHFDPAKTLNDWASLDNWENNECGSGGCEGFQRAALNLVRQTQQDRVGVEDHLLAAMTGPQREEYQRLKRVADRPDPDDAQADGDDAPKHKTAAALTDTSPLLLPMVVDEHVFLASVGHFTIGWRVFSDWKVAVETGEGDKTREIARFAIGMTQGPIISVSVK
jgi:hypothetical protein